MTPTSGELVARYRAMSDEELVLLKSRGGLLEEAVTILQEELVRRGIAEEDCQRIVRELDNSPMKPVPLMADMKKGLRWLSLFVLGVLGMGMAKVFANALHQHVPVLGWLFVLFILMGYVVWRWRSKRT